MIMTARNNMTSYSEWMRQRREAEKQEAINSGRLPQYYFSRVIEGFGGALSGLGAILLVIPEIPRIIREERRLVEIKETPESKLLKRVVKYVQIFENCVNRIGRAPRETGRGGYNF